MYRASGQPGALFSMTNNYDDNCLLVIRRKTDGLLKFFASISTGEKGSGPIPTPQHSTFRGPVTYNALGSPNPVLLVQRAQRNAPGYLLTHHTHKITDVYMTNAGSHSITHFEIHDRPQESTEGLSVTKRETIKSYGHRPISLAMSTRKWANLDGAYYNVLYVLNAATYSISCIAIGHDGTMIQHLGHGNVSINDHHKGLVPSFNLLSAPSQLTLSANDKQLVVSVRGDTDDANTNGTLVVFDIEEDGTLSESKRRTYTPREMVFAESSTSHDHEDCLRGPSNMAVINSDENDTIFLINFAHSGYSALARLNTMSFHIVGTPLKITSESQLPFCDFASNIWLTTPRYLLQSKRQPFSSPATVATTYMMGYGNYSIFDTPKVNAAINMKIETQSSLSSTSTIYKLQSNVALRLPIHNAHHITGLLSIISGSQQFVYATEPKSGSILAMQTHSYNQLHVLLDTSKKFSFTISENMPEKAFDQHCSQNPHHEFCRYDSLQGLAGY